MRDEPEVDLLHEMAFAWSDIERHLARESSAVYEALRHAYRVEAVAGENGFGDPNTVYDLYFNREDSAARVVKGAENTLDAAISAHVEVWDRRYTHRVLVLSPGREGDGIECERLRPQTQHVAVEDVPTKPSGTGVPFTERDGHVLTPIEVPFYDALRETGATFAVQPWVQGVDGKYRPDFIVFYGGASVIVELDGHDAHKTKEQRAHDNRRARWFDKRSMKVVRYTGSEVHADAQACVKDLLDGSDRVSRGTRDSTRPPRPAPP
jgi:very-short-patch-repair endonuclease